MYMERTFEVLRGWPNDGALDRAETIKSGSTLNNGDIVAKQSDGTVDKIGATAGALVGYVFAGNGDSASAALSGKATVLWGNFIGRTSNYASGAYAPGTALKAVNGQLAVATVGTDPVVAYVLEVNAAGANGSASASAGSLTFIAK